MASFVRQGVAPAPEVRARDDVLDPAGSFDSCAEGPPPHGRPCPFVFAVTFVRMQDKSYREHDTVALRRVAGQLSAAGPGTPRQPGLRAKGTLPG